MSHSDSSIGNHDFDGVGYPYFEHPIPRQSQSAPHHAGQILSDGSDSHPKLSTPGMPVVLADLQHGLWVGTLSRYQPNTCFHVQIKLIHWNSVIPTEKMPPYNFPGNGRTVVGIYIGVEFVNVPGGIIGNQRFVQKIQMHFPAMPCTTYHIFQRTPDPRGRNET